jgi:hypothetical protein
MENDIGDSHGTSIALGKSGDTTMDAFVIGATLVGSFVGAFALQKAALEGLFRIMDTGRRARH